MRLRTRPQLHVNGPGLSDNWDVKRLARDLDEFPRVGTVSVHARAVHTVQRAVRGPLLLGERPMPLSDNGMARDGTGSRRGEPVLGAAMLLARLGADLPFLLTVVDLAEPLRQDHQDRIGLANPGQWEKCGSVHNYVSNYVSRSGITM